MFQKAKPKRKNLSPDELLQEAHLLYPENEAFIRGKTKELHPKATIFANIRARKYGFPLLPEDFLTTKPRWKTSFTTLIMIIGLLLLVGLPVIVMDYNTLFHDASLKLETILYNLIGLPVLIIGLLALGNIGKMVNFTQRDVQRDYTHLVKSGKLLLGEITELSDVPNHIVFHFSPPNTSKEKRGYWYFGNEAQLREEGKIIILYVDDKLCIVL